MGDLSVREVKEDIQQWVGDEKPSPTLPTAIPEQSVDNFKNIWEKLFRHLLSQQ